MLLLLLPQQAAEAPPCMLAPLMRAAAAAHLALEVAVYCTEDLACLLVLKRRLHTATGHVQYHTEQISHGRWGGQLRATCQVGAQWVGAADDVCADADVCFSMFVEGVEVCWCNSCNR